MTVIRIRDSHRKGAELRGNAQQDVSGRNRVNRAGKDTRLGLAQEEKPCPQKYCHNFFLLAHSGLPESGCRGCSISNSDRADGDAQQKNSSEILSIISKKYIIAALANCPKCSHPSGQILSSLRHTCPCRRASYPGARQRESMQSKTFSCFPTQINVKRNNLA